MGVPIQFNPLMLRLSPEAQSMVEYDYQRRRKSKAVGYLAWFFLGWHYLYLRRVGLQFAFWLTAGGFFVWWFVDLFRVGPIVNRMNEDLARDLITQYQSIYREPERSQVVVMPAAPQPQMIGSFESATPLAWPNQSLAYADRSDSVIYPEEGNYGTARDGFFADTTKLLVIAGSVVVGLVVLGTVVTKTAGAASSQGAPLGVYTTYRTTGTANVRSAAFSRSDKLGSIEPGIQVHGVAEVGPNGIARWVKLADGPYEGGFVSAVNLETE